MEFQTTVDYRLVSCTLPSVSGQVILPNIFMYEDIYYLLVNILSDSELLWSSRISHKSCIRMQFTCPRCWSSRWQTHQLMDEADSFMSGDV